LGALERDLWLVDFNLGRHFVAKLRVQHLWRDHCRGHVLVVGVVWILLHLLFSFIFIY
jgi:hypothetical protein